MDSLIKPLVVVGVALVIIGAALAFAGYSPTAPIEWFAGKIGDFFGYTADWVGETLFGWWPW